MPKLRTEKTIVERQIEQDSDIQTRGDSDLFEFFSEASSQREGWKEVVRVAQLFNGCIVQTTTQQFGNLVQSSVFVRNVKLGPRVDGKRSFVAI